PRLNYCGERWKKDYPLSLLIYINTWFPIIPNCFSYGVDCLLWNIETCTGFNIPHEDNAVLIFISFRRAKDWKWSCSKSIWVSTVNDFICFARQIYTCHICSRHRCLMREAWFISVWVIGHYFSVCSLVNFKLFKECIG
ncbi:hypothetical protein C8R42DRAFT_92193, partial [Lentinula raphanica]